MSFLGRLFATWVLWRAWRGRPRTDHERNELLWRRAAQRMRLVGLPGYEWIERPGEVAERLKAELKARRELEAA